VKEEEDEIEWTGETWTGMGMGMEIGSGAEIGLALELGLELELGLRLGSTWEWEKESSLADEEVEKLTSEFKFEAFS